MKITLREADINDLATLQRWDGQQHVIDSDPNDDWNWPEELPRKPSWRRWLMALLEERPIGFVQIIDPALEETRYWGEVEENLRAIDIWLGEVQDLNKGYGTVIMQQTIELCFSDPQVKAILLDPLASNVRAHKFYERLGFQFVEERQFGLDLCYVYKLARA